MKKALLLFGVAALLLGALPLFAADFAEDQMHIIVQVGWVGVTLYQDDGTTDYTDWVIGMTGQGALHTMDKAEHIEAENKGNCAIDLFVYSDDLEDYSACVFPLTGGTAWSPAAAIGAADEYLLECGENDDAGPPAPAAFIVCPLNAADGTPVAGGIPDGAVSHLYLGFTTPAPTSDGCQHDITVTVRALPN